MQSGAFSVWVAGCRVLGCRVKGEGVGSRVGSSGFMSRLSVFGFEVQGGGQRALQLFRLLSASGFSVFISHNAFNN